MRKPGDQLKRKVPKEKLIKEFWEFPNEAFFNQETVAAVRQVSIKTIEADRTYGTGVPFRKVGGRVLYRKSDILEFIEKHELVTKASDA